MGRVENRVLADHVYDSIKRMIEDGVLAPGTKVRKQELAETLGVSQTPINEALNRLTGEKYLFQESRQGYFVEYYSDAVLADLFAVRAAIEGIAARLCAEEATDEEIAEVCSAFSSFESTDLDGDVQRYEKSDIEFHRAIIRYSHNEAIRNLSHNHGYITKTLQRGLVRPPGETLPEHRAIIDALRVRDGEAVQHLMNEHHLKSRKHLKESSEGKRSGK